MTGLRDDQYELLFTFRCALRQFLRWSEQQAALVGLTGQQHQLLLAVRSHAGPTGPSIGELAGYLLIRPNSAVELVGRAEAMGLVDRAPDALDQRVVRLSLTPSGRELLERLAVAHLDELENVASTLHISEEFLQHLSADFIKEMSDPDA